MKNCLLLGKKGVNVQYVKDKIDNAELQIFGGTDLEDVQGIFSQYRIDIVIMGAGLDLEDRLEIIKYIFENSTATTVHMKDWDSGPAGMLPFVQGVLGYFS